MAMGRPSEYEPRFAGMAESIARLGGTDIEIARALGINRATLYRWRHDHPDFCDALKVGKEFCDERVKRALYERAIGYSHPAVEIISFQGVATKVPVVKHYPPDPAALKMWLVNRCPSEFREKVEHEHSGKVTLEALVNESIAVTATVEGGEADPQ